MDEKQSDPQMRGYKAYVMTHRRHLIEQIEFRITVLLNAYDTDCLITPTAPFTTQAPPRKRVLKMLREDWKHKWSGILPVLGIISINLVFFEQRAMKNPNATDEGKRRAQKKHEDLGADE